MNEGNSDDVSLVFSKIIMISVSISCGGVVFWLLDFLSNIYTRIIIGIIVAFSYPIATAYILRFCYALKSWGYMGKAKEWTLYDKIFFAAMWPFTLVYSMIIYIFLGIINRMFN